MGREWSGDETTLARDWRVVNIPDEDSRGIDVATLFRRILDHFYDPLEPFVPAPADYSASIRAAVGRSQQGDFVCVADVVQFGVYMKFFVLRDAASEATAVSSNIRNAAEVSFFVARSKPSCI